MPRVIVDGVKLHKYERFFYFVLWIGAVFYAIYRVYLINTYFDNYDDSYGDFAPGWVWIGRKQDISDIEWRIWIPLLIRLIPWIFFQHTVGHVIRSTSQPMLTCCWYICVCLSFLYFYIGGIGMMCALIHPSILYILVYKRCRLTIWMINISFLFILHFLKTPDGIFQSIFEFNDEQHYILMLVMCWSQLRSISYSIDTLESKMEESSNSMHYFVKKYIYKLAYCLYLPTVSLGPLVLYRDFVISVEGAFELWSTRKLSKFLLHLLRYMFWILFTSFSLHFFYFSALQYHPEVVKGLDVWTLYGLGYCMGQFFLIKYVVVYGLNHIFCAFDNIEAPSQPKCVARIHLYSDMWKYFDQGLYKFLVKYIYVPSLKANFNKVFASFLCFAFVFLWHGMQASIFIWSFLNFLGLNLEGLIKAMEKSNFYLEVQRKYMSEASSRRFTCIVAAPLLAMSVMSNFYFFAGLEIGNIYINRLLYDSWKTKFVLLFFLYCCCQVSIDVKEWESKNTENHNTLKIVQN